MNNTTSQHLKHHFLAIFAPFTPLLSINGINTPLRHDPTILTPFWANMGKIRGKKHKTISKIFLVETDSY
jgi:hypothetical protein